MKKAIIFFMGFLLAVFIVNVVTAQEPASQDPSVNQATSTEVTGTEPAPAPESEPATEPAPSEPGPAPEATSENITVTEQVSPAPQETPAPAPQVPPAGDLSAELSRLAQELGIKSYDELKASGEAKGLKADYNYARVEVADFGPVYLAHGTGKYGWTLIRKAGGKSKVSPADQLKNELGLPDNDKSVKALIMYVVKNGKLSMEKNKKGNEQAIFSLEVAGKKVEVIVNASKFKGSITFVKIAK